MSTSDLISSTEQSKLVQSSAAKELLTLLRPSTSAAAANAAESTQETKPIDKLERKREAGRRNYQKHREELIKLRANQVNGICILLTQPDGKILTHRLACERDYIDFITSIFETYKLEKQIVDFRVLPLTALPATED